jgi:transposase InsO family protein
MPFLAAPVSSNVLAALLLLAQSHLRRLDLVHPAAAAILTATGAGRSRSYELADVLAQRLATLERPVGRPKAAPAPERDTSALSQSVIAYLMEHPGAVVIRGRRRHYSDGFRTLALRMLTEHPDLERREVAEALGVPPATLDDWAADRARALEPEPESPQTPSSDEDRVTESRIAAILDLWRRWDGGFSAFAEAVRRDLEIDWGPTRIGTVLSVYGDRRRVARPGRGPDEKALRSAFQTFFPGAQWTEDGTQLAMTVNGERFVFNLELVVDTATAALVGAHVSEQENADAVAAAFEDAVTTAGAPPLALGTDNATENDAPEVQAALGETLHIHATLGRPQNDAHVEGAFGLFEQTAPHLAVQGRTARQLAASIVTLVVTTWGRTLNHRPRKDRSGRSRVELYRAETPTPDQIAAAREALLGLQRAHDQARQTRQRRLDPTARAAIDAFCLEHGCQDPTGNVKDAIAGYGLDAVLAAIATWTTKKENRSLPDDVGLRYLLGIARNIAQRSELTAFAEALCRLRSDARDLVVADLERERQTLTGSPEAQLDACLARLVQHRSNLRRLFWLRAAADILRGGRPALYRRAVDTLAAAYRLDVRLRATLIQTLAEHYRPIDA